MKKFNSPFRLMSLGTRHVLFVCRYSE